jgi:hypothetical protein
MAKLKITKTDASGQIHDRYTGPEYINSAYVGGTGGLTSQTGRQILANVYVAGASQAAGSILAQKGAHKFQVSDGTNIGKCTLTNSPIVQSGQMSIQINTAYLTSVTANAYVASGASTSAFVTFTATGPVTPYVGQYITNLGSATGNVVISAINGTGNVTVTYPSQTFANVAGGTAYATVFASRITNRYVYDFGSDNVTIDGENGVSSTYYTTNFNPNKYRYHLATPDSTFVQVAYA